jgi:hypothetical protein
MISNRTPYSPLSHIVYIYTVYLFTQGRGEGGELNKREGERGNTGDSTDDEILHLTFMSLVFIRISLFEAAGTVCHILVLRIAESCLPLLLKLGCQAFHAFLYI